MPLTRSIYWDRPNILTSNLVLLWDMCQTPINYEYFVIRLPYFTIKSATVRDPSTWSASDRSKLTRQDIADVRTLKKSDRVTHMGRKSTSRQGIVGRFVVEKNTRRRRFVLFDDGVECRVDESCLTLTVTRPVKFRR